MAAGEFDVGGRRLSIRNLDRVIFPRSGTRGYLSAPVLSITQDLDG